MRGRNDAFVVLKCFLLDVFQKITVAECIETQSKAMMMLTIDQLSYLLKFALQKMKQPGVSTQLCMSPWEFPANQSDFVMFPRVVCFPRFIFLLQPHLGLSMFSFLPNPIFGLLMQEKKSSLTIEFAAVEKRSRVSHTSVLHGILSGMHVQMISNHRTNSSRHCAVNSRSRLD